DEDHLAGEEVVELQAEVDVRVLALLEGQFDVEADRTHAGLAGPAVRGLHHAGTAAGDDREAGFAEPAGRPAGELVGGVVFPHACGAEERDRRSDPRKRLEAAPKLVADALEAGVP